MPLTDSAIRTAKPKETPYRLFDAGRLYLEVSRAKVFSKALRSNIKRLYSGAMRTLFLRKKSTG